jgi:hypothetical protein
MLLSLDGWMDGWMVITNESLIVMNRPMFWLGKNLMFGLVRNLDGFKLSPDCRRTFPAD